jgi:hypothetical protein
MQRTSRTPMSDDERKYRRLKRQIATSRRQTSDGQRARQKALPSYRRFKAAIVETHAAARARLVAALLASGWSVRAVARPGARRRPVLVHPNKAYGLSFYGRGVAQDDFQTLDDCRGWTLEWLLVLCDQLSTPAAQQDFVTRESLADMIARTGIPHEVVCRRIRAFVAASHDKRRKRPPSIPRFRTEAKEHAFWASHDVLEYFGEPDFLLDMTDADDW